MVVRQRTSWDARVLRVFEEDRKCQYGWLGGVGVVRNSRDERKEEGQVSIIEHMVKQHFTLETKHKYIEEGKIEEKKEREKKETNMETTSSISADIQQFLSLSIFVFLFSNSYYFSISATSFTVCILEIAVSSHVLSHVLIVLCLPIWHIHKTQNLLTLLQDPLA